MTPAARKRRLGEVLRSEVFEAAHGLTNPHAQTIFAPLFRRRLPIEWRQERWITPDDDFLRVFVADNHIDNAMKRPSALLVHGLEGSVRSPYLEGLTQLLLGRNFRVIAYEQRGSGPELNRARRLYHSGTTEDLAFAVAKALERWPDAPLYIAGVSLGGNQLGKWLGTEEVPDAVRAAAILSPPFNLTISAPHMDHRMPLYVRRFLRSLIPKALAKARQYPGELDEKRIAQATTFDEFDTHATAALHGFRDALDYYERVSCGQFLGAIKTPTLLIAADDDPFNPGETIPRRLVAASDYLLGLFPDTGGHVGFIANVMHQPRYWAEERIAQFFDLHQQLE